MNLSLPSKLPRVTGKGTIAAGFRMAFESINRILEVMPRIAVKGSPGVKTFQTPTGTTLQIEQVQQTTTQADPGAFVARWQ